MVNCAIIGATGYTGMELIRILLRHSYVNLSILTTRQKEAIPVQDLIPQFPHDLDLVVRQHTDAEIKRNADVIFLCLPHTEAAETAKKYHAAGKIVIDLSADLRLKQAGLYRKWYGFTHKYPALLSKSVYGLPELNREDIRNADLIANPGCYPTAAILSLYPLLEKGLIRKESIAVSASSGVSGAGKKLAQNKQYYELDENYYAYKVGKHQHTPEIEQLLSEAAGKKVNLSFVTHLLPVQRGILSTAHVIVTSAAKQKLLRKTLELFYATEPFVRVLPEGKFPSIKDVCNTNFCDIGIFTEKGSEKAVVISAIDNLVKGASGQAVQNMNIRLGFPEDEGLRSW